MPEIGTRCGQASALEYPSDYREQIRRPVLPAVQPVCPRRRPGALRIDDRIRVGRSYGTRFLPNRPARGNAVRSPLTRGRSRRHCPGESLPSADRGPNDYGTPWSRSALVFALLPRDTVNAPRRGALKVADSAGSGFDLGCLDVAQPTDRDRALVPDESPHRPRRPFRRSQSDGALLLGGGACARWPARFPCRAPITRGDSRWLVCELLYSYFFSSGASAGRRRRTLKLLVETDGSRSAFRICASMRFVF